MNTPLLIAGGIAAYVFRNQIEQALGISAAGTITSATGAADAATAAGATPAQAATAAAHAANASGPTPATSGPYTDAQLLAGYSVIPIDWRTITPEQIGRVAAAWDVTGYANATRILPDTPATYVLGLGGPETTGETRTASDGKPYTFDGTAWNRLIPR